MIENKKLSYSTVVALGFLVYFFSYSMRLDYSATLVAIVADLKITNTIASAAVTGSFITYAIGQLVFGFIGDKISPIKIINFAMIGTIFVNLIVSFVSNITLITVLWCFNGLFQAMIWPPLTRFIAEQVGVDKYSDAIAVVVLSSSMGTIFVYIFATIVLKFTIWRTVFRSMAFMGILMVLAWSFFTRKIDISNVSVVSVKAKNNTTKTISIWGLISLAGLIPIFIINTLHGVLKDGIQIWLPSLANQKFGFSESTSILTTAVLPILSMISVLISNTIYRKLRNELKTATIMFFIALISTIPIIAETRVPAIITITSASLIAACMHGVNHMVVCVIPRNFSKYGMVSTFSGIINAFTYLGSSISTYGFAAISDAFGWNTVLICWCIISFFGMGICALKIKGWAKFINLNN